MRNELDTRAAAYMFGLAIGLLVAIIVGIAVFVAVVTPESAYAAEPSPVCWPLIGSGWEVGDRWGPGPLDIVVECPAPTLPPTDTLP